MAPARAVFIAEPSWLSIRGMDAWLESGNEIAEIWCFSPKNRFLRGGWSIEDWLLPAWSARRLMRRRRLRARLCPPLRRWPGAAERAEEVGADTLFTLMTGQIVPASLLARFGPRAFNIHPTMLPHYRGPMPRQSLIMDGQAQRFSGVTLHQLTPGIDEGPIIGQRFVPYDPANGYADWDARQSLAAADLVAVELTAFLKGELTPRLQEPGVGGYRKVAKDEFSVTVRTTLARARDLADKLSASGLVHWKDPRTGARRPHHRIGSPVTALGPPTGERPRILARWIETDLADARVRLRRRRFGARLAALAERVRAARGAATPKATSP